MEVVDTVDKANEQQSTVQHHAQMPEPMFEDVFAEVQPQTVQEQFIFQWLESLRCSSCSGAIQRSQGTSSVTTPQINSP